MSFLLHPPVAARNDDDQWPAELRAAVASYPRVPTSPAFEANFWHALKARRAHAQTWRGRLERLAQVELGGWCVWRLAGSTFLGAALPALVLALGLAVPSAQARPFVPVRVPPFSTLAWRELERQWSWKTPFRARNQGELVALWLDGATGLAGGAPCGHAV